MGKGKVNIPPPPGLSQEERDLIKKQTQSLDFYLGALEEQKSQNKEQGLLMAVTSGLYDPVYNNGQLVDATLNADKVAEFQTLYARNTELQTLSADRYERALRGELPVSEGTLARKEQDFKLLREAAARKGVTIAGNSLEEAALSPQDSTAGNELVQRLNRTYRIAEDSERRGELAMTPGTLGASTLGAASGAVSQFNPQGYLGAVQGAGYIAQPFAQQRELGYQATLNQAALNSRKGSGLGAGLAGAGTGAAIGTSIMPGWGTAIGAGIGGVAGYFSA